MSVSVSEPNLVWIDMEMTGLDPERDTVIEIATIVTTGDLDVVAEGPVLAVHQPDSVLGGMDEWNTEHHGASGLTERVRASKVSLGEAEERTLDFVRQHTGERQSPLCGNSIWQDRRFLVRYMATLEGYLHYRIVDVSSIKELVRRWYPDLPQFEKKGHHLALDDVRESIEELRYYRSKVFLPAIARS